MTSLVRVNAEHEYEITIGSKWNTELASNLSKYNRAVVVVAHSLFSRVQSMLTSTSELHLVELPDGEAAKSSQTLESLWNSFGSLGLTRNDVVVAIGGGATTDIVGFAAATWLRGVDWFAVPTSLAGMVDAAVGGKTGMNSHLGKNLIGAFHSPRKVIIDVDWLDSLSDRDFAAGLAEVVKCGFIADPHILLLIEGKDVPTIRSDREVVEKLIDRAVSVKARVVSEDFRESFTREILNYGHTMGHAIELNSQYSLRHGEAVSIGMAFVAHLSHLLGLLSDDDVRRHIKILEGLGLPTTYPESALADLLPLLYRDKKTRGTVLRFIAVNNQGEVVRLEGVTESEIATAYGKIAT